MNHNMFESSYFILALVVSGLLLVVLLYLVFRYKKDLHKKDILLVEHEEKIKYLRQISAENEHRNTTTSHENEKEILKLKHTIEGLETKIKEGTKNQVVAMLEAQKNKRAKALNKIGVSE